MTTATLPSVRNDSLEFISPFRALLWMEWRESRRQFFGCVVLFFVLPAGTGFLYDLATGYQESAIMALTVLGGLVSVPLAAGWGAYAVCRDLTASRAKFVLAQPINARSILLAKALVSTLLFAILVFGYSIASFVFTDFVGDVGADEVALIYLSICGLVAVLAFSFMVAVILRRLVPAILCGLTSALVLIVAPISLLEYFSVRHPDSTYVLFFSAALLGAAGLFLCIACLWGWRADRAAISNRAIGWGTVIMLLAGTALVSNSLATNTEVVATFGESAAAVLGSDSEGVYWQGYARIGELSVPTINRTSFDSNGSVLETKAIKLLGLDRHDYNDATNYLTDDFSELLVVRSTYDSRTKSIFRFDLDFDRPESLGELIVRFVDPDLDGKPVTIGYDYGVSDWRMIDGTLFGIAETSLHSLSVGAFETTEGQFRLRSMTPQFSAERAGCHVRNGELGVIAYSDETPQIGIRRFQVDRADPDHLHFSSISELLMLRCSTANYGFEAMSFVASRGDRIAVSTEVDVGTYHCDAAGRWTELGWRRAGFLEKLSGRYSVNLSWHGDRLFEVTQFGVLVYDVSSNGQPRRIGHVQGPVLGKVGWIDARHFVMRGNLQLEVHRLPE